MKPPPRLLDDPALAPELRSDLERTAGRPYAYDAAAGLAALHAAIGALQATGASSAAAAAQSGAQATAASGGASTAAPAVASGGAGTAAAAGAKSAGVLASAGGKLALAATGAALVAASVIAWPRPAPERTTARPAPAAQRSTPTPATPEAAPAPEPAAAEQAATAEAPAPSADAIDTELARIRARAERAGNNDADAALRREIAELGRIKTLLDSDPAQAYWLAQAGHRQHRRGMLRQEREGLAVLALWNLDRRGEAAARAHAFLARYPASPLGDEVKRRLQAAEHGRARESR